MEATEVGVTVIIVDMVMVVVVAETFWMTVIMVV